MSDVKDYKYYMGDINLEYGGFFANLDDWKYGYAEVLRITDLDSGCGFAGAVRVEKLIALGWDEKSKVKNALQVFGFDNIPSNITDPDSRKMLIVDAMLAYGYYDPDSGWDNYHSGYSLIVQCDSDPDYAPMQFDGWKADVRLSEDQKLLDYLEEQGYLSDFE